ncbi:hypothetical protein CROQUDRAFT_670141 [Cronartium quercuum f. sp. fusiforme G11]|uniref:F-box domain-containing protein n=1 Tax=Cronartium quercuum f. sp. fusiforme G11 TaxID=708437 RepID=A0A9P6TD48_9BASI|nr:hypothetical protein CROQUDRAFT_670141 [Cronartium quercuum f. sp. fusiforme G11]
MHSTNNQSVLNHLIRSTSPSLLQDHHHVSLSLSSSHRKPPTNPTHDEACFVDPPFPSPMPLNRHSITLPDHASDHQLIPNSPPPPIARTTLFNLIGPSKSIRITSVPGKVDFLSRLPVELSLYILLGFQDPLSLARSRAVCRSWKILAEDPVLWHELFKLQPKWAFKQDDQFEINRSTHINYGSSNRQIARRLSLLLGESIHDQIKITNRNDIIKEEEEEQEEITFKAKLDWFEIFRDRYIIDRRWKEGNMMAKSLKGHQDSVYCLQFDDQKLVTGSRDKTVKIWNIESGLCLKTLKGHTGSVLSVRFDEEILLSGSSDCKVLVWDLKTTQIITELTGHTSGVLDLALNSSWIISGSKDSTVRIWSRTKNGILPHRTISGHVGPVNAIALTSTGQLLTASGDSSMKLWDPSTGVLIRLFEGHLRGLACIALAEGLGMVISGSKDETIKIWDLKTGACLRTMLGHEGLVRTLEVNERERRLVSGRGSPET